MISFFIQMLSYGFIQRAFLAGILVSLCAALLGVILVLKHLSMIGDGLSHVGFGVLSVATALGVVAPLYISLPLVGVAAVAIMKINARSHIRGDEAIALIASSALAIGVAATSLTTGMNADVCNFMFGSILAMSWVEVALSVIVSLVVLAIFLCYRRQLFAVTFDEDFARACGLDVGRYTNILAVLAATVIVLGMRMMGVMLISSVIIFPAMTAMCRFRTFRQVLLVAAIIGVVTFSVGMYLSYVYNISTGAVIILVNLLAFVLFWLWGKLREVA